MPKDKKGILLRPRKSKGEIGVLNPTLHPKRLEQGWPFLYRTRRMNKDREYSTINFRWLEKPKKLSKDSRTIIVPKYDFESWGCEDPRLTKAGDIYYITYVAYDGLNARIAVATTKDFQTIEKHGIISPNISLEEAVEIVGDEKYKERWGKILQQIKRERKGLGLKVKVFLYDKDPSLHHQNGKWFLIHRIDPNIHIAVASSLDEFQNQDFWRNYLRTINEHILMSKEEGWNSLKIGLGSPPIFIKDRWIAVYHGVEQVDDSSLVYRGSFVEIDPKTFNPKSRLKEPLFEPEPKDVLKKYNTKGEVVGTKSISFPTAILVDPSDEDILYVYSGKGDKKIDFRSTSISWLLEELKKPQNKIKSRK